MTSPRTPLLSLKSEENFDRDAVEADDELWAQYVPEAADYDKRMVDEWTKLVDTVMVFDALFIGILSAFALGSGNGLQRDSGDIANDLLVAIYTRLSNSSAPVVDPKSFFNMDPAQQNSAVYMNTLLYSSLAISIITSLLAAVAKLWLLRYSRTVVFSGPSFERAMKRQEIYNGAVAWRLKEVIESMPVLISISVSLFALYIHHSIAIILDLNLGFTIGMIFALGLLFILIASISAAFIPTSPFQSAFSDFIRFIFKIFPDYPLTARDKSPTILRIFSIILMSVALATVAAIFSVKWYTGSMLTLVCFPMAGAAALLTPQPKKNKLMKPRIYGLPEWFIFSSITTTTAFVIAACHTGPDPYFFIAFIVGCALIAVHGYYAIRISKFAPDTTEAEAVTWMLKNSSSQRATWFRKARDIGLADAKGTEVERAVLFDNLLPLLSPLIVSIPHNSNHKDLRPDQVDYIACLAQLCKFTPSAGSFWKHLWLNEVSFPRPQFSKDVREKLECLRNCKECSNQVRDDAKASLESG